MALRFADGFDWLAVGSVDATIFSYKWDSVSYGIECSNDVPRSGGVSFLKVLGTSYQVGYVEKLFYTPISNTLIFGSAWREYINDCGGWFSFYDNADKSLVRANTRYNSTYDRLYIEVSYLNTSNAYTAFQSLPTMHINEWYYFEYKVVLTADNSLDIIFKIDNEVVINESVTDYAYTTFDVVKCRIGNNSQKARYAHPIHIDDLYFADSSGSYNNDFLGGIQVNSLKPNNNGMQNDFTPYGQVNNYECVDELGVDTNDYVASGVVGHEEIYQLEDLPTSLSQASIKAVVNNVFAKRDDAGDREIQHILGDGSNKYVDSTTQVVRDYIDDLSKIWETNPLTGSQFQLSDIANLQSGIKIAS